MWTLVERLIGVEVARWHGGKVPLGFVQGFVCCGFVVATSSLGGWAVVSRCRALRFVWDADIAAQQLLDISAKSPPWSI